MLAVQARFKGKLDNLDPQLRRASGFAFYNTSRYGFEKLLADAAHVAQNLRNYIAGFSPNMREVLEKFDFDNTISKLNESGLLFQVVQRFGDPKVDLQPDAVDNAAMGTIFEELIRKFNEALNENPGEHSRRATSSTSWSNDPCCGSGGMLTIAKEHVTAGETRGGEPRSRAENAGADAGRAIARRSPTCPRRPAGRPCARDRRQGRSLSRWNRTRGPGTAGGGHTRSSSGTSRAVARLLSAFTDPGFTPRSMAER